MNDRGLCFDAAVVPDVPWTADPAKQDAPNLLELILDTRATVDAALRLFDEYPQLLLAAPITFAHDAILGMLGLLAGQRLCPLVACQLRLPEPARRFLGVDDGGGAWRGNPGNSFRQAG